MARASICAEWVMWRRHGPECPGRAPVTDCWQAASLTSTRIFLPSLPSQTPPASASTTPCSGRSVRVRRSAMTVWSTRIGRNCSIRSSASLGRLSVGACAMPSDGSSLAACSAPTIRTGGSRNRRTGRRWAGLGVATGYARRRCVGGHTLGERVEVGVGTRAFDAHDFGECARLSRSTRAASARTRVIGLVSEAWASSPMIGVSVSGRASAERPARTTRLRAPRRTAARTRRCLPWS